MILLYNVASHVAAGKVYNYFGEGYKKPPREIASRKEISKNIFR